MSRSAARRRVGDLLTVLKLEEWADVPLDQLSGGTARLIAFCFAIVCPGQVVILDEPTNDVDPLRRRLMWDAVRDVASGGCAVLLVTHNVLEAQQAVDRLVIIDRGRVVVAGRPYELGEAGRDELRLEFRRTDGAVMQTAPIPLPTGNGSSQVVAMISTADAESMIRWCTEEQSLGRIEEFRLGPVTLEDIYLASVTGAA
jgi:ABC-2 type transport system ATP-binding protein